ncbi:hypothetical protein M011DRAFT_115209 [Sporormia fimetaria CBS 119925]|uniref:Uncharacterized protein n=1 Tax=Sporormia fimetaria CBS 119925 TaxID=1340428 RepID=A0A6A6VQH2_9PLEO|nr:hypothetical protein M011DRAFT_115209 [Sporormia fimetaria CBS 119925]
MQCGFPSDEQSPLSHCEQRSTGLVHSSVPVDSCTYHTKTQSSPVFEIIFYNALHNPPIVRYFVSILYHLPATTSTTPSQRSTTLPPYPFCFHLFHPHSSISTQRDTIPLLHTPRTAYKAPPLHPSNNPHPHPKPTPTSNIRTCDETKRSICG